MIHFRFLLIILLIAMVPPRGYSEPPGGAALKSVVETKSPAALPKTVVETKPPAALPKTVVETKSPDAAWFTASRIVINIPSRTLWVYDGDRIVRYFPVGVGKVGYMTPLGRFSVIRKVIDPGWENPYMPNGKLRLAPGEDNPLGTRWIGFYQKRDGEYGLHGTDNPASVGKFSSHGCVRMKVTDAEALFDLVDVGTPVEVVYQPVLVRRNGSEVRVIVYADHFRKGMPTSSQMESRIRRQYPGVRLDASRLRTALRQPTEKPVTVGMMPEQEPVDAPPSSDAAVQTPRPQTPSQPVSQTPAAPAPAKTPAKQPVAQVTNPTQTPTNAPLEKSALQTPTLPMLKETSPSLESKGEASTGERNPSLNRRQPDFRN